MLRTVACIHALYTPAGRQALAPIGAALELAPQVGGECCFPKKGFSSDVQVACCTAGTSTMLWHARPPQLPTWYQPCAAPPAVPQERALYLRRGPVGKAAVKVNCFSLLYCLLGVDMHCSAVSLRAGAIPRALKPLPTSPYNSPQRTAAGRRGTTGMPAWEAPPPPPCAPGCAICGSSRTRQAWGRPLLFSFCCCLHLLFWQHCIWQQALVIDDLSPEYHSAAALMHYLFLVSSLPWTAPHCAYTLPHHCPCADGGAAAHTLPACHGQPHTGGSLCAVGFCLHRGDGVGLGRQHTDEPAAAVPQHTMDVLPAKLPLINVELGAS